MKIKVAVFDDYPQYVNVMLGLLEREGYEARGIVVTLRTTSEEVIRRVKAFGPHVLIADRECWSDEQFGVRVIAECLDIKGLHILSSSGKPTLEMERISHRAFSRKEDLVNGCTSQTEIFLGMLRHFIEPPKLATA